MPLRGQRLGRVVSADVVEQEMPRDRFDVRALPFDRGRTRETMKAGLQLRLTGDAGGLDTSFDVAGPVSALMRHALR